MFLTTEIAQILFNLLLDMRKNILGSEKRLIPHFQAPYIQAFYAIGTDSWVQFWILISNLKT